MEQSNHIKLRDQNRVSLNQLPSYMVQEGIALKT